MGSSDDVGYQIDWELKVFAILCIFAFLKLIGASYDNIIHCFIGRSFFIIFHAGFFFLFQTTKKDIEKSLGPTHSKQEARKAIFDIFKGLLVKAILVGILHFKVKMMPPLFISCIMGCFSILENREFLYILQKRFPVLVNKE